MTQSNSVGIENIDIEIPLFLEAIFQKYSYDFRDYSKAHVKED